MVFGDIGTSPLYALQIVYSLDGGVVRPTPVDVYGVVSLIFWAITLIVSVKYIGFVMRADNDGEGGIMALTALVQRATGGVVRGASLVALGVFGAALFYGDSVITPAISVLSAVEGLKVAAPGMSHLAVPLALAVLTGLFAIQRWGTAAVGRVFGPVMLVWFAALGASGAHEVAAHPDILRGLSPTYAVEFVVGHPGVAFVAMGAVMLAITGAEALYADMGHFGRPPIRRAWFWLAFPALTLNYLGQSALVAAPAGRDREPVLPSAPVLVAHPDGAAGDGRHGDRLPGRHLRRVLALAPGRPARLLASPRPSATRPATPRARSTCRWSTGRCSSSSLRSSSASGRPSASAAPTASRSAGRS